MTTHQPDSALSPLPGLPLLRASAGLLVILVMLFCAVQTGRLALSYAAVRTGANRAAVYAVSGALNPQKIPTYQDCAAIRTVALQTGWMGAFDENDIEIRYLPSGSNCPYGQAGDHNLEVRVHGRFLFVPLVRILPLPLSASHALTITPAAGLPAKEGPLSPGSALPTETLVDEGNPLPLNPETNLPPPAGSLSPIPGTAATPLPPASPGEFDPPDPDSAGEFYSTPPGSGNKTPGAANPTATFSGYPPARTATAQPTQTRQPCTVPIESGGCP